MAFQLLSVLKVECLKSIPSDDEAAMGRGGSLGPGGDEEWQKVDPMPALDILWLLCD